MASQDEGEDIHKVINDVLGNISKISEHLRCAGANEAANDLNRDMTRAFRTLYNVIADWSHEKCHIAPRPHSPLNQTTIRPSAKDSAPNTWAAVAATTPTEDRKSLVKYRPCDGIKRHIDLDTEDRRVIWITNWSEERPLTEITQCIEQLGALFSIAKAPEHAGVCIIFQLASVARAFKQQEAEIADRLGHCRLGRDIVIHDGAPYPMNDDLKRMGSPQNERRRLTFARQALFTNGLNEREFRQHIEAVAGAAHVELLWLFNTGNATVVFSAVPLARLVYRTFYEYAHDPLSPYHGVVITYSQDPCEKNLNLVTQMPVQGKPQNCNGYEYIRNRPDRRRSSAAAREPSPNHRYINNAPVRPARDDVNHTVIGRKMDRDGWQVVPAKKR